MPVKKLNLPSAVKNRLKNAILDELGESAQAPEIKQIAEQIILKAEKSAKKIVAMTPVKVKQQDVKLAKKAKAELKPKSAKPAKAIKVAKAVKASKATKIKSVKSAKLIKPIIAEPIESESEPETIVKKSYTSNYRPFAAKRDWEKTQPQESLESLFKKPSSPISDKKFKLFTKEAPTPKAPREKKHKGLWLKLVGLLVLLVILLIGFDILGVYQLSFKDPISLKAAQILNLPAGQVNGKFIAATDYLSDISLLNVSLTQKREGVIDYSGKSDLADKVFYRLAAIELMQGKLAGYNLSVSAKDLDNQVASIMQQTGGQTQAEKVVGDLYGLNLDQFKAKVLKTMMMREQLQKAIMSDDAVAINKDAKDHANEVLKLARASSTDFSALAKKYTDDESSVNTGGDLGWVVKGQLDPAWESLIFGMSTGTVVTQLVKSNYGYHIIKVEQKLIDKTTGTESVKLRHILIAVDVDKYIKDLLDNSKIVRYIK